MKWKTQFLVAYFLEPGCFSVVSAKYACFCHIRLFLPKNLTNMQFSPGVKQLKISILFSPSLSFHHRGFLNVPFPKRKIVAIILSVVLNQFAHHRLVSTLEKMKKTSFCNSWKYFTLFASFSGKKIPATGTYDCLHLLGRTIWTSGKPHVPYR